MILLMKNDGVGGRVYSPTDVTSYERKVCTCYTTALYSPIRLSMGTALVRRGLITKDTIVCRLICAAIGAQISLHLLDDE